MPNCFQLFDKATGEGPLRLNEVDEAIAEFLGEPVHPRFYCRDWFGCIGFLIAMGSSLGSQQLRDKVATWIKDEEYTATMLRVLTFMESRYTSDAFVEIGRR